MKGCNKAEITDLLITLPFSLSSFCAGMLEGGNVTLIFKERFQGGNEGTGWKTLKAGKPNISARQSRRAVIKDRISVHPDKNDLSEQCQHIFSKCSIYHLSL